MQALHHSCSSARIQLSNCRLRRSKPDTADVIRDHLSSTLHLQQESAPNCRTIPMAYGVVCHPSWRLSFLGRRQGGSGDVRRHDPSPPSGCGALFWKLDIGSHRVDVTSASHKAAAPPMLPQEYPYGQRPQTSWRSASWCSCHPPEPVTAHDLWGSTQQLHLARCGHRTGLITETVDAWFRLTTWSM